MRVWIAVVVVVVALRPSVATAAPARLGEPSTLFDVPAFDVGVYAGDSDANGPRAVALFEHRLRHNVWEIAHRDSAGRWRRFAFSDPSVEAPRFLAVRFARLGDGAELVAWDDGDKILGRVIDRDGNVSPQAVILDGVNTVHGGDNDFAEWQMTSDRRGTVVVATTGAPPRTPGAVYAMVRDPGGWFGPAQELTPSGESGNPERELTILAIQPDGSVTVRWGDLPPGTASQATRSGRAASFGPAGPAGSDPAPSPFIVKGAVGPARAIDGTVVEVSAAVAAHCPCRLLRRFTWDDGTDVLVWDSGMSSDQQWWLARRRGGEYTDPQRVSRLIAGVPVQQRQPGEIALVRSTTTTDYQLFRQRPELFMVPFGHTADRHRPTVHLGPYGQIHGKGLLVPAWCDEPCVIRGRASGRSVTVRDFRGAHRSATLEPNDVAWLFAPRRGRALTVTAAATDLVGKHATPVTARYHPRGARWCRVPPLKTCRG